MSTCRVGAPGCGCTRKVASGTRCPAITSLDAYLNEYIDAAGVADEPKGWLFRSTRARSGELTENALSQADVYRMIRRRALAAGIRTQIGNHTFRATGITEYLRNGGKLEINSNGES